MKKLVLSLTFLLLPLLGFSQTFEGSVIDKESRDLISDATVMIDGTKLSATTDDTGRFTFNDKLPFGEQVVIITKSGYEDKFFLIDVSQRKKITVDKVGLEMTKDEKKRRKKIRKAQEREEEDRLDAEEDRLKEAKKNREKEEKRLAKERKRAKKNSGDIAVTYDDEVEEKQEEPRDQTTETPFVQEVLPIQIKYGSMLGVTPEEITNIPLYKFIDSWMGTTYKMGGANKEGIDCSSFAQRLFTSVYGTYIERTAQKQFDSKYTEPFLGKEYLREGDLIFFGDSQYNITHVGVYLDNNMFVNATSRRGSTGVSGVKLSNLAEVYWTNKFVSGGKRIPTK